MTETPASPPVAPRGQLDRRTALALLLLGAVILIGLFVYFDQQSKINRQG
jgi:hypothetical protein